jgi:small subunit ribosomal protein S4
MARYRGPKNRIARRFGANIFGKARNPLLRKANPPGQHGARRRKQSDFGIQLSEKQKLKACFGMISEKQLVNIFHKSSAEMGNTTEIFIRKLECRLDNLVYRLGFAPSIFAAQQLVSHGHICVDGKKVDRRSFLVKPGMQISIRERSRACPHIVNAMANAKESLPVYLELDKPAFSGKLIAEPHQDQVEALLPLPVNISSVCEFLSHHH